MKNIDKLVLPSNGLIPEIPREVTVRAMQGDELSTLYSSLTDASIEEVIQSVTKEKLNPDILCDEDKAAILHKTRRLTFGDIVQQTQVCPHCQKVHTYEIDYNDFEFTELDIDLFKTEITLSNGDKVTRRLPNKEILQDIEVAKKRRPLKKGEMFNVLLFSKIETVNGKRLTLLEGLEWLSNLKGTDWVLLSKMLDIRFGLNVSYVVECPNCELAFTGGLGINADLFR